MRARVESFFELERTSGDRALLMVGLSEPMYSVQALMGSETFGFWLMDERELLHEMVDRAYRQIEDTAKHYLAQGIGDAYGWVGPELCIPPLASPRDFQEFVSDYDRPLIDLVHDADKLIWVHCHGDMNPVLEDFVDMGVDCLNPIEPPPVGRLTLAEAKRRVAGCMCLEGGVQNGDFELLEPEEMVRVVEEAVAQGKPGGGFILSSTSTPTTWTFLSERLIANHRAFIETGARLAVYD
jgi:uroporphyrinogen decarboxylase